MTPGSAEKSWSATQLRRTSFILEDHRDEVPPPKSLSDYGLSPDMVIWSSKPDQEMNAAANAQPLPNIKATAYTWVDPTKSPRRDFVYGRHLIRKFVSATVAPGGVGKSSLEITEALAMVSGRTLLGVHPSGRSKVWVWNLEDPAEEIARHVQATAAHYNLKSGDLEGHLFIDSGRDQRLVIATTDRSGTFIVQPVVDALVEEIIRRGIDVLIIDPFVSSHEAPENDNSAMDKIIKEWGRVAQRANCAVELVHHSRKSSAGEMEITVESSRGGKALTAHPAHQFAARHFQTAANALPPVD
jgi:RecA-family ATPase